jgi:glucokinase
MNEVLVGIDVGGSKTEAAVAAIDGTIVGQAIVATGMAGETGVLRAIEQAVSIAIAQSGCAGSAVLAAGIGIPGQVDPETGIVHHAVNLSLRSYPLRRELGAVFGDAPVIVENDVRLAALGVYHDLQNRDPVRSLAYLSIGTGIAAGIVVDGQLYRGAHGMAGEIGHVVVDPGGTTCNCGLRGCLETVASGPAIAARAGLPGKDGTPPDTAAVFSAAARGQPRAVVVVEEVAKYLSQTLHWLAMTYDVERIVVGGGVSRAGAALWEPLTAELEKLRAQSTLAATLLPAERVMLLTMTVNPGVFGALALAQKAAGDVLSAVTNP